jgi:hypothetical protein
MNCLDGTNIHAYTIAKVLHEPVGALQKHTVDRRKVNAYAAVKPAKRITNRAPMEFAHGRYRPRYAAR